MKTKRNKYIRSLTKDDLIRSGIKEITEDCKVIFEDGRVLEKEEDFLRNEKGYFYFLVEETDPEAIFCKKWKGVQTHIQSPVKLGCRKTFPRIRQEPRRNSRAAQYD